MEKEKKKKKNTRNYCNLFVFGSCKDPPFDLIYTVLAELQQHQSNVLIYSCSRGIKVKLWLSQELTPVHLAGLVKQVFVRI